MQPVGEQFLMQAIQLAVKSVEQGGGPFGAVIVRNGTVIATGNNQVTLHNDPTAHAEMVAIREACTVLGTHILTGCVLYSSCEPCPMCLGAIYWARLDAVWYVATRSDAARAGFSDSLIYHECALEPSKRTISMRQLKIAGGDEAFKLWQAKNDKVMY